LTYGSLEDTLTLKKSFVGSIDNSEENPRVTEATEVTTDTPTQQTKEPESIAKIQVTTK